MSSSGSSKTSSVGACGGSCYWTVIQGPGWLIWDTTRNDQCTGAPCSCVEVTFDESFQTIYYTDPINGQPQAVWAGSIGLGGNIAVSCIGT